LASLPAPAPLAPSARRFLKPLVGIDPDTVRVHRGPAVSQLADRGNADALTVGDQVVLGPGLDERSPSTLGVLAHELTHAARVREPRFVPPIVHESMSGDEEPVALEVERAVRHAAQHERAAERSIEPRGSPESIEPRPQNARRTIPAPTRAPDSVRTSSHRVPSLGADPMTDDADMSPWGGLPAPWEPLPEVLTHMLSQPGNGATAVHASVAESLAPSVPVAASAAAPAAPAAPAVQAAARDRSIHEPVAGEAATKPSGHGPSPAPDVDALARQVYDVLKRRLAAERRRGA
jgi:hypothetical protein